MDIDLLEYTENNFSFACFFWQYVIKNLSIDDLNIEEIAYWGKANGRGATVGSEVHSVPQWFVRTRCCIPVRILLENNTYQYQCFKGSDVYSSSLSSLIGFYLPIFEWPQYAPSLNEKWLRFFRFKIDLSIDDHFTILQKIYSRYKNSINDLDDDLRIQRIYASLLSYLSNTDMNQLLFYREKFQSKNIYLLSKNNIFKPPNELCVWCIDNFRVPSEYSILKLNLENRRHPKLFDLLNVFNVNKIEEKDLILSAINEKSCDELKNRLHKSHLLILLKYHKIQDKNISNILDNFNFIEADQLDICLHNNSYQHIANESIYITKPWNSPSIIDKLSSIICRCFNLSNTEFITSLSDLLTAACIDTYLAEFETRLTNNNKLPDEQFSNLIKRDNVDLIKQINNLPSSLTPAQLLISGLETQAPHWTGYVYYYTHLENVISILKNRCLSTNNYIRFTFRPLTSSQAASENLGCRIKQTSICPIPIFICIKLESILNIPNLQWKTHLDNSSDIVHRFDFRGLFSSSDAERYGNCDQYEFLIENQLNFDDLSKYDIHLICQNRDAKQSLELLLNSEELMQIYHPKIKDNYFFNENSRIHINHDEQQDYITIIIDGQTHEVNGLIIVQIKYDSIEEQIDLACNDNICAVFHQNLITTIYGKDKKFNVLVGKRKYAVYYQLKNEHWLIYTNYNLLNFDSSHKQIHSFFLPL